MSSIRREMPIGDLMHAVEAAVDERPRAAQDDHREFEIGEHAPPVHRLGLGGKTGPPAPARQQIGRLPAAGDRDARAPAGGW